MSYLVSEVIDSYHDLMDNKSDQRVKDWFLMSSPLPTLLMCLTYAYGVKVVGPKLMENRKPFNLRKTIIFYNLFQVLFSIWLFHESCVTGWLRHYSFRCQPVDYSNDPTALRMARGCWWYYFSKFTEFMDTIFFVLRKKNSHISTLHVIHHGVMPMSVWFGVKFTPGGHSTFFGFLNTFVHIIMYTYYFFAALGPQYQKYLWWKKYLTALQMIQFVLVMVHAFQLLFIDCDYPRAFVWWIGLHAVMFYFLFSDFYKRTYNRKDREAKKIKVEEMSNGTANGTAKHSNGIAKAVGICFPVQTDLYENGNINKHISKSYTSDANSRLRNRAFIDSAQAQA
ncbi:hypothetical protein Trydic_g18086 [Trypoxylus dichotomus]